MCSSGGVVVVGGSGSGGSSRVSGSGSAVVVAVTNIVPVWAANMTRAVMRARMSEHKRAQEQVCRHYAKQTRTATPCCNVCRLHDCVVIRAKTEQNTQACAR